MNWFRNRYFPVVLFLFAALFAWAGPAYMNLPAGTRIQVRVIEKLSSETAQVGDRFHGTLAAPLMVNGRTVFLRGADVSGQVTNVERSGRLSSPGELHLALRTIQSGGRVYAVSAQPFVVKGESHTKSNVTKIGGSAAAGAIIGALAGGGKGAAIGAGVGAAAGTGIAAATGKKAAEIESEAVLTWVATPPPAGAVWQAPNAPYPNRYAEDQGASHRNQRARDDDEAYDDRGPAGFSERDRQTIRDCFVDNRSGLPPGLAKRDRLPPGLERHLERNGTLPPGLQKRVQPLPSSCDARLPRLPRDWSRVVLSGRIILLGPGRRIVDLFWLASRD